MTNGYDQFLRRTNLAHLSPGSQLLSSASSGSGTASLLATVSDGTHRATNAYLANSPLVSTVTFKQNPTTRMTTTKSYDLLNRLMSIVSSGSQLLSPISYAYSYNSANQRTRRTEAENSYWNYEFDALGQVWHIT